MAADPYPELVTVAVIVRETGLPRPTVQTLIKQAVRAGDAHPSKHGRVVLFRRSELAPYFGLQSRGTV